MSIASCSELERRMGILRRLRSDLAAFNVPNEAWPRRAPMAYGVHTAWRAGSNCPIQVFILRGSFFVTRPPCYNHGIIIGWEGDAAQAWDRAKRFAGWE